MPEKRWTFITSHGAVLALIAQQQQITARQIAQTLGMTERPIRRIIAELLATGYIEKTRVGRANRYTINRSLPLRMAPAREIAVGDLLEVLKLRVEQPR